MSAKLIPGVLILSMVFPVALSGDTVGGADFVSTAQARTQLAVNASAEHSPSSSARPTSANSVTTDKADIIKRIYPRFGNTWVGDPMPLFDQGQLEIFYLNDLRIPRARGYHPWYRASSVDLLHYHDHGEVLEYVDDLRSRERALGTGSIIKRGDTYHAFYTGHNPRLNPVEVIMHATSKDKLIWQRHLEDTLPPPEQYSRHSFRDPHVVYVEQYQQYWMLVTTRYDGDGVIARFTSDDLRQWQDAGVLFVNDIGDRDANLEVPTLFNYGAYWYLSFSDQKPTRRSQYRLADQPLGPFRRPSQPAFDGRGFYAGKIAVDDKRMLLAGWTPTKSAARDRREFMWAGNLVIHELIQIDDGELLTVVPKEIESAFAKGEPLQIIASTNPAPDKMSFSGDEYQITTLAPIDGIAKISGRASSTDGSRFGFAFDLDGDHGDCLIVFDRANSQLRYYNIPVKSFRRHDPQIALDYNIADSVEFSIYIDGSVLVMYVDGRKAFSTRIHSLPGNSWGVFSLDGSARFEGLDLARLHSGSLVAEP